MVERAQVFRSQLCHAIGRERMRQKRFADWQYCCVAIDRRRRRIDKASRHTWSMSCGFEQFLRCQHITMHISFKLFSPACTHSGLSSLMKNPIYLLNQSGQIKREQVAFDQMKTLEGTHYRQVSFLYISGVIIDKAVNAPDFMSISKQAFSKMRSNKSCHTGDQTLHTVSS